MFGMSRATVIQGVNAISMQALERHAANEIVLVSMAVEKLLSDYRRDHPDKVPTKPSTGLLGDGMRFSISDFELALQLAGEMHPVMMKLERSAGGVPPLMAYLAVASLPSAKWPDIGWDSALRYAVAESGVRLQRTQQLQDAVSELGPLAAHGKLFIENKKSGMLGPVAVKVKAYMMKHPKAKSVEVWDALKKVPPKGHDFRESSRLGRYIEKGAETVMEWPRFRNLVSVHRPKK